MFHSHMVYDQFFIPFQGELQKQGLSFSQAMILLSIYFEKSEVYPTQLSETLLLTSSNVSHCLTYLVKKNWLVRLSDKKDARKTILKLTSSGINKTTRLIKYFDQVQNDCEKKLSEKKILEWNKTCLALSGLL